MSLLSRDVFVRCAALLLAMAPVALPSVAKAQAVQENAAPPLRRSWLEPRVSVQYTATSNVRRDATQRSDQVTE